MRLVIKNMFLLGIIAMGSMMFGMTSCCDDEKNNQGGGGTGGGGDTPKPAVTSISLSKKRNTLSLCDTMQLVATILPAEAEQGVTWSSSSTNAKVEGGKVTISKDASTNGEKVLIISQSVADADKKDTCIIKVNTHRMRVPANGRKNTYAVQLWDANIWWAEFNVGATIESYKDASIPPISDETTITSVSEANKTQLYSTTGNYFSWGGLSQYIDDSNPEHYKGDANPLPDSCDVARQNWGGAWRMPTGTDAGGELYKLTTGTGTGTTNHWCSGLEGSQFEGSSIPGRCFKGKNEYANDSIFFPATGYCDNGNFKFVGTDGSYWSSVPGDRITEAWGLGFGSGNAYMYYLNRFYGLSVRAVCAK